MSGSGPVISNGKALANCERCGKWVQLNKPLFGALHFCVNDCEIAGKHLDVREEIRGHLWWKRTWVVCGACGREQVASRRS